MAMQVKDVKAWLDSLRDDDTVFVDEHGFTLKSMGDVEAYLEVGGLPDVEGEDEDDKWQGGPIDCDCPLCKLLVDNDDVATPTTKTQVMIDRANELGVDVVDVPL